jgi:hypothetical protein
MPTEEIIRERVGEGDASAFFKVSIEAEGEFGYVNLIANISHGQEAVVVFVHGTTSSPWVWVSYVLGSIVTPYMSCVALNVAGALVKMASEIGDDLHEERPGAGTFDRVTETFTRLVRKRDPIKAECKKALVTCLSRIIPA